MLMNNLEIEEENFSLKMGYFGVLLVISALI